MPDIATLRTEIKEWERSFKETNGRDASIDDIKELPHIAEKYKLYKKLRKAEAQYSRPVKASTSRPSPPSTPPRGKSRNPTTLEAPLLAHSRHAETTAPLTSFNPFSPQKNKQKQREHVPTQPQRSDSVGKPLPNPFATPVKGKGRSTVTPPERDLSPEPYPLINPLAHPEQQPAPNTAISRARKRLRGEPVSPSPNKPKRQRTNPQVQTLLSFKPLDPPSTSQGTKRPSVSDDEESDVEQAGNLSFVGESPVKQPSGGKSFKVLFEDIAPLHLGGKGKGKAASKTSDIFSDLPKLDAYKPTNPKPNKPIFMETSHPLKGGPSKPAEQASKGNARKKRRLSVSDDHNGHDSKGESENAPNLSDVNGTQHAVKLIPPSPPPADPYASKRYKQNAKSGKDKAVTNNRKKSKINKTDDNDSSDGSDEWDTLEAQIRIVNPRAIAQQPTGGNLTVTIERDVEDPILALPHHVDTLPGEVQDEPFDQSTTPLAKLAGLSINSAFPSKERGLNEGQLVRGLLYGRPPKGRLYDPRRGGEIWGVGEGDDDDEDGEDDLLGLGQRARDGSSVDVNGGRCGLKSKVVADTEEDDDWEGEPVPWEVGEL